MTPKSRGPVVTPKVLLAAISALAFVVVAYLLFRPVPKTVIEQCAVVLKGTVQEGASLLPDKTGAFSVQVGVLKTSEGVVSEDQRLAFMACIRDKNVDVIDTRLANQAMSLGELAALLASRQGMKLRLMPVDAPPELYNMRVDAFVGEQYQFAQHLCSTEGQGSCVECTPSAITASTPEVEVRLKAEASLIKEKFATAPLPGPNVQLEPYQLVDADGSRYWFRCQ